MAVRQHEGRNGVLLQLLCRTAVVLLCLAGVTSGVESGTPPQVSKEWIQIMEDRSQHLLAVMRTHNISFVSYSTAVSLGAHRRCWSHQLFCNYRVVDELEDRVHAHVTGSPAVPRSTAGNWTAWGERHERLTALDWKNIETSLAAGDGDDMLKGMVKERMHYVKPLPSTSALYNLSRRIEGLEREITVLKDHVEKALAKRCRFQWGAYLVLAASSRWWFDVIAQSAYGVVQCLNGFEWVYLYVVGGLVLVLVYLQYLGWTSAPSVGHPLRHLATAVVDPPRTARQPVESNSAPPSEACALATTAPANEGGDERRAANDAQQSDHKSAEDGAVAIGSGSEAELTRKEFQTSARSCEDETGDAASGSLSSDATTAAAGAAATTAASGEGGAERRAANDARQSPLTSNESNAVSSGARKQSHIAWKREARLKGMKECVASIKVSVGIITVVLMVLVVFCGYYLYMGYMYMRETVWKMKNHMGAVYERPSLSGIIDLTMLSTATWYGFRWSDIGIYLIGLGSILRLICTTLYSMLEVGCEKGRMEVSVSSVTRSTASQSNRHVNT